MKFWNDFAAKHPAAAKWVREGGLFVIVSNLITVFKYLLLQFLPAAFSSLPVVDFGWPGVDVTLFGETFKWNILGYDAAHGINCVWVAVAGLLVPDFIYNIGTTVLNGGVSMVIFFFVNKIIFPESGK